MTLLRPEAKHTHKKRKTAELPKSLKNRRRHWQKRRQAGPGSLRNHGVATGNPEGVSPLGLSAACFLHGNVEHTWLARLQSTRNSLTNDLLFTPNATTGKKYYFSRFLNLSVLRHITLGLLKTFSRLLPFNLSNFRANRPQGSPERSNSSLGEKRFPPKNHVWGFLLPRKWSLRPLNHPKTILKGIALLYLDTATIRAAGALLQISCFGQNSHRV